MAVEKEVKRLCEALTGDEAKQAECAEVVEEYGAKGGGEELFRLAVKRLSEIVGLSEEELTRQIAELPEPTEAKEEEVEIEEAPTEEE